MSKSIIIDRYLPFIKTLKTYNRNLFSSDLSAGIMVAILLVPQAIAYAHLAGMPPEYGLYAALIPILIYAIFGTSPHLAIGPVAITAILMFAGVSQLEDPFTPKYIELIILAGLMIGVIQVVLSILKKGSLVNLVSYPVISGFTSAASVIIIASQFKDVLGIHAPQFESFVSSVTFLFTHISETNFLTLIMAICSISFIILSEKINRRIPSRLILVTLGILASYFFDLSSKGVSIIEHVPSGLPDFASPKISTNDIIALLPTVILVTLIGIIESVGIAKALENKNDFYEINTNKELFALGISKIGGSFFSALPSSGSFSRSAILHQTKAKTNIASLITFLFVIFALLFLTQFLFYLPKVILAVIIIYAVKNLFEFKLGKHLLSLHKFDFVVMFVTFITTLFLSLEIGVAIGFLFSFIVLRNTKTSTFKSIIRVFSQKYSNDISLHKEPENDSKVLVDITDNLHFGNAYYLKDLVNKKIIQNDEVKEIELYFQDHCDMDSSALKALREVLKSINMKDKTYEILNTNEKLNDRLKKAHIKQTNK